jgi:hypothetical protein
MRRALSTRERGLEGRIVRAEGCGDICMQTVRGILRLIFQVLLWASFGLMIGLGLLMAYGLVPEMRGGQASELIGWDNFVSTATDGVLGRIFFSLSAVNLVLIWGWLIHCAARLDFWRLFEGIFAGVAIIGALLFLTPSYCSRSGQFEANEAQGEAPTVSQTFEKKGPLNLPPK